MPAQGTIFDESLVSPEIWGPSELDFHQVGVRDGRGLGKKREKKLRKFPSGICFLYKTLFCVGSDGFLEF